MENKIEKTTIELIHNGPIKILGEFEIKDAKGGEIAATNPAFFCRCGQSKNKPFCDGTHRKIGFEG